MENQRLQQRLLDILETQDQWPSKPILRGLLQTYVGDAEHTLNYYGPPGTIKTIPYGAVLSEPERWKQDLAGKVVFVGRSEITIPEQIDHYSTVYSGHGGINMSGVEIIATAFANLLTAQSLRQPTPLVIFALLLSFGILAGLLAYAFPGWRALLAILTLGIAYFGVAWSFFEHQQLWFPLCTPLAQLLFALPAGLLIQYLETRKERETAADIITRYSSEEIAETLIQTANPGDYREEVYGVCLASDVEDYTHRSEPMSAQELSRLKNAYFDALVNCIKQRQGIVVDIAGGDSMTAVWPIRANRPG